MDSDRSGRSDRRRSRRSLSYALAFGIGLANGNLMALAGLWENWRSPAGEWLRSFAIITTKPNELCAELHNRMPVVLKPETWPVWLGEEPAVASALKALLTPFPSDEASRTLRTSSGPTLRADHTAIDTGSSALNSFRARSRRLHRASASRSDPLPSSYSQPVFRLSQRAWRATTCLSLHSPILWRVAFLSYLAILFSVSTRSLAAGPDEADSDR